MSDKLYEPGVSVRLTGQFRASGVLGDPTEVTLKVKDPLGTTTTYLWSLAEVTREAAGIFYVDVVPETPGRWFYRWIATGTLTGSVEESFRVRNPEIE